MATMKECDAPRSSCGTPSGWRAGGRCLRCRGAHNLETARRRGLPAKARADFLALLRSGMTVETAAKDAGTSVGSLVQAARRDGELRAALDGMPTSVQVAAQRAAFFSALVRCGGDPKRAEEQAGIRAGAVWEWRQREPEFDAAVEAVLAWLDSVDAHPRKPQTRLSDSDMGKLCEMWREGVPTLEIANDLGVSRGTVLNWGKRLGLPPRRSETADRLPELGDQFRQLWESGATYTRIQAELNISNGTVVRWRKKLNLSERRQSP
ncbi:hypothetical protein [Streptomyces sp. NPDC059171]|uniref:hypothetical protein n=1 Tax=Streptomyces sp. NPDC059171 TaxID=3346755 RepID=UPI0036C18207